MWIKVGNHTFNSDNVAFVEESPVDARHNDEDDAWETFPVSGSWVHFVGQDNYLELSEDETEYVLSVLRNHGFYDYEGGKAWRG